MRGCFKTGLCSSFFEVVEGGSLLLLLLLYKGGPPQNPVRGCTGKEEPAGRAWPWPAEAV